MEEEDLERFTYKFIYKVWKIEKKSSGKQYAVKEISKVRLFEMNSVSSVMNERRLLAHLRHPFIINMHYAFQEKEHLYIVMDYKQGGDLRYHINKNKGGFSEDQVSKKISLSRIFYFLSHFSFRIHAS